MVGTSSPKRNKKTRFFESTVSFPHPQQLIRLVSSSGSLLWLCRSLLSVLDIKSEWSSTLNSPSSTSQTQASHKCIGFCVQQDHTFPSLTATIGKGAHKQFYFLIPSPPNPSLQSSGCCNK